MSDFRARVGRIRMKSGGADVRVLHQSDPRSDRCGEIVRHARQVADVSSPDDALVGHMVIGIFASGKSSVGIYHNPDTCPIPRALMPAWVEEITRRDLIVETEARDVFDEMFEWRDK